MRNRIYPQHQPRGARLKLVSQLLQEELFESTTSSANAARKMNDAVATVIDDEFAPAARVYFEECVEAAR
jgi:hypothetical protein